VVLFGGLAALTFVQSAHWTIAVGCRVPRCWRRPMGPPNSLPQVPVAIDVGATVGALAAAIAYTRLRSARARRLTQR
jgi:hypothetical protein